MPHAQNTLGKFVHFSVPHVVIAATQRMIMIMVTRPVSLCTQRSALLKGPECMGLGSFPVRCSHETKKSRYILRKLAPLGMKRSCSRRRNGGKTHYCQENPAGTQCCWFCFAVGIRVKGEDRPPYHFKLHVFVLVISQSEELWKCKRVPNLCDLDRIGDLVDLLVNEVLDPWRLDMLGGPVGLLENDVLNL